MAPAKKRKNKETNFLKVRGRWLPLVSARQKGIVKNGAHRLEHKDDTHGKGKKRKKKKRWHPWALAKEREGMMTAPLASVPGEYSSRTLLLGPIALKLANESSTDKFGRFSRAASALHPRAGESAHGPFKNCTSVCLSSTGLV